MTRKLKMLIVSLFLCMSITFSIGMESKAEDLSGEQTASGSGMQDENPGRLEAVTGMNEDGSIVSLDDVDGNVESGMSRYYRSANTLQVVNFRTKGNAVTNYTEAGTGVSGYTNGAYGADAAYLGTSGSKVRFMLAGVVGNVNASEVQVISFSDAKAISHYGVSGGRLIHYVATNLTSTSYGSKLDNGPAPSYLSAGTTYYSYDGHYFYTDYGQMISDYQNNIRSHSVNAENPYYNYFQYLPLRSRSGYSGSELEAIIGGSTTLGSKMRGTGSQFVDRQNIYGVNALLMTGVAANESAWGQSNICQTKNNLFGLNAVDSSPGTSANTYASVDECIKQFANAWMSRQYLCPENWKYKGGFLGNKASGINVSYASDPYWGEKAAAIAWKLDSAGQSKDNGTYTIAIKDTISTEHNSVNVRSDKSTSSTVLYKTGLYSNYSVIVLDSTPVNSFYRIQSDAVLNAGRTGIASGVGEYDFDNMYAHISSDYVTVVNKGNDAPPVKKELTSITISTPPAKTSYVEGEIFDAAGMKVTATWSDGSTADVTGDISYGKEPLSVGISSVKISYTSDGITVSVDQSVQVTEKVAVSSVEISPAETEIKQGESLTFGVLVTGTGNPSQKVVWSIEGAQSENTRIDENGKLEIGADETAQSITVKAVSTTDESKTASALVTVVSTPVEEPDAKPDDNPDETPGGDGNQDDTNTPDTDGNAAAEIKDENTGIQVNGTFAEGTTLGIQVISSEDERYNKLVEPVKNQSILGVYYITLSTALKEGETAKVSFPVDESYNGKTAVILHYAQDGEKAFLETYKAEIKDSMAVITVKGFSPFVIALEEVQTNPPVVDEPDNGDSDTNDTTIDPPVVDDDNPDIGPDDGTEVPGPGSDEVDDSVIVPPVGDVTEKPQEPPVTENTVEQGKVKDNTAVDTVKDNKQYKSDKKTETEKGIVKAPKTGDTSMTIIWVMLLAASAIVVLLTGYRRFGRVKK